MADVKWIKLNVGMFDGNSFKRIKKAKIGGESFRDKLTAVWFELMDFAGKCNADGQLIESPEIPFMSIDDIAVLIDREPEELNLCMQYFISSRMISVIDDVYMLTNWAKYQNTDKMAELREYNRLAQQRSREKRRLLGAVNDASMTSQECQCTDIDIDKDIELDKEKELSNTTPTAPKKHKYGEHNNVLLTDEEYTKLQDRFPSNYEDKINALSEGLALKGYKYKSHYLAILKWAKNDEQKAPQQTAKSSNPFLDLLREG